MEVGPVSVPLHVLILEDRADDAALMLDELQRAGFAPDWKRVETAAAYLDALKAPVDVILADYTLPQFDALTALRLLQASELDIPFIVVTGSVSEEAAVECMKQGAADYLLKDRLARLGSAVAHALEEQRLRAEKRKAETALRESREQLRRRAEQLAEADRRKNEFLALLSHELRNPLAPIFNAVHLLRLPGAGEAALTWARDVIARQARHMARLIDDLLNVSRITQGKLELRVERVNLVAIAKMATDTTQPLMVERRHELTVSFPPEPVYLEADPDRLTQVLTNLLDNAAKYTEPGGHIWLTVEGGDTEVVVRVRDTGIGIRPIMLKRIFEPFAQLGRSESSNSQWGLGLGLMLVRSLVEMHGGSVHAFSEGLGKGSEFVVRLPLVAKRETKKPGPDGPLASAAGVALRVLIVEDNHDTAESEAKVLELAGHEVYTAFEGITAVETARDHPPDVVLLDIGLPGMDGYEVARRLQQEPGLERALLVALTGFGQEEDRRRSSEAGFAHHLVKPVDPDRLCGLLAGIVPRQPRESVDGNT
jgi:signal transduction histidine kinase